jgi:hypothetical protein
MLRRLAVTALLVLVAGAPARCAGLTGQYVEARTCDVWTGPCFANAEMNLGGKQAVLGWKVESGTFDGVRLDGLGVVAVIAASDTLGLDQTGTAKAVLIVDRRASRVERDALVRLARKQGGDLLRNVVATEVADVSIRVGGCDESGCASLTAGKASVTTRCLDVGHDKVCGNESAYYPPLTKGTTARPAIATEHGFAGKGLGGTWKETDRRGAYVGSFEIR